MPAFVERMRLLGGAILDGGDEVLGNLACLLTEVTDIALVLVTELDGDVVEGTGEFGGFFRN